MDTDPVRKKNEPSKSINKGNQETSGSGQPLVCPERVHTQCSNREVGCQFLKLKSKKRDISSKAVLCGSRFHLQRVAIGRRACAVTMQADSCLCLGNDGYGAAQSREQTPDREARAEPGAERGGRGAERTGIPRPAP